MWADGTNELDRVFEQYQLAVDVADTKERSKLLEQPHGLERQRDARVIGRTSWADLALGGACQQALLEIGVALVVMWHCRKKRWQQRRRATRSSCRGAGWLTKKLRRTCQPAAGGFDAGVLVRYLIELALERQSNMNAPTGRLELEPLVAPLIALSALMFESAIGAPETLPFGNWARTLPINCTAVSPTS
mgnify:CR=1 FL=1